VKRAGVLSELGYTRRALDAFGEAIRRCDEDAAAEGARAGQQGAAGGSTGRSGWGGSDSDSGSDGDSDSDSNSNRNIGSNPTQPGVNIAGKSKNNKNAGKRKPSRKKKPKEKKEVKSAKNAKE
jgi:hypothetical protein